MKKRTIYVALLDEGVNVWRPVAAEQLPTGNFRILLGEVNPEIERWEFPPGSVVRCESRKLSEGVTLVAVAQADSEA